MTRMALFAAVLMTVVTPPVYSRELVYFADPNLKAAVEEKLGISEPNAAEILALTSLTLRPPRTEVNNLAGLEYAKNLAVLLLGHPKTVFWPSGKSHCIADLSPLSLLTNLRILSLVNSQITDISDLSKLTNMTSLTLRQNQISDISALAQMTKLIRLRLTGNNITDISVLSGLTDLKELSLEYNQINDISVLANFKKLENLYLSGNRISDISALAGLTNLRSLWLGNNQISDISALSEEMENLKHLNLRNNRISDISVLTQLPDLRDVELEGNPLNEQAHRIYIPAISALTPPKGYRHPDLTPPPIPTIRVASENDYDSQDPCERRRSERLELIPESVWRKICEVTLTAFNSTLYEDLTKYSDLFGSVSKIQPPDYHNLNVYLHTIKGVGTYSDILSLILHDCTTDMVTPNPPCFSGRWLRGCLLAAPMNPPMVYFDDLNLDGYPEVVFKERIHNGTELNAIVHHYLHVDIDMSLLPIFRLEVCSYHDRFMMGHPGYLIRTIEKQEPNRILVRVSVSNDPFSEGEMKVGHVVLESNDPSSPFLVTDKVMYLTEKEAGRWYGTYAKLLLNSWLSPYRSK